MNEIKQDLGMNRKNKSPPEGYLCHLCYTHGHFIKDCLYVSTNKLNRELKNGLDAVFWWGFNSISRPKTVFWWIQMSKMQKKVDVRQFMVQYRPRMCQMSNKRLSFQTGTPTKIKISLDKIFFFVETDRKKRKFSKWDFKRASISGGFSLF